MSIIIKNNIILNDNWLIFYINNKKKLKNIIIPNGKIIIHINIWNKYYFFLKKRKNIGIWIFSFENFKKIKKKKIKFKIIAINFINFLDGRGYSLAYEIRNKFNFLGELRAIGNVLRDQIFYMKRVGFNSFLIKKNKNIFNIFNGLYDFSEKYQSSFDEKKPLFLRKNRKFKKFFL
ncbi:DUF934 domain-containing protein [Candidatus Zinderia endosymbiont of Aphrophora alni]|uniref:DUF934 domain-containing protein n=1 Tax=Candidatus Zinderia endosymbiont of Aphrophora alni TaxID=3077951 RepID=UPI0030CFB232